MNFTQLAFAFCLIPRYEVSSPSGDHKASQKRTDDVKRELNVRDAQYHAAVPARVSVDLCLKIRLQCPVCLAVWFIFITTHQGMVKTNAIIIETK
jgi:hypothetical protein